MQDIIKVNTARLAADSDRIRNCIENMMTRAGTISEELIRIGSVCDSPEIKEAADRCHTGILELQNAIMDLEKLHLYENEACMKYERCVSHVDSVIEGLIL